LNTESDRARKASRVLTLMLANLKVQDRAAVDKESISGSNSSNEFSNESSGDWPEALPGLSKSNGFEQPAGFWDPDTEHFVSEELSLAEFENNFDLPRVPTTSTISPNDLDALLDMPLDLNWVDNKTLAMRNSS